MSGRSTWESHEVLAIHPEWALRADDNKMILCKVSLDESTFLVLPPHVGIVLPLFNGNRTLREVAVLLGMVLGENDYALCLDTCVEVLDFVNKDGDKVASVSSLSSPPITYSPEDFAVDFRNYSYSRRLNKPFRALLFPSNRCKTNCIYCYAERRQCDEMSRSEWSRIIEQMQELKFQTIDFSGGDALARKDGIGLVSDFVKAGLLFLLSTKCYISPSEAAELADAGFANPVRGVHRLLQISVDAADPHLAAFLTQTPGYLESAKKTAVNLLAVGISPRVKAVLTSHNANQVKRLFEDFSAMGVRRFGFSGYGRSGYRHDDRLFLSERQKVEISEVCQSLLVEHPDIEITGNVVRYSPEPDSDGARVSRWESRSGCSGGFISIGIAPDGKVILCEQVPQEPPFIVGDLRKQSIMDVWNSDAVLQFIRPDRDLFRGTICYDCEEFEPCHYDKGWCYRDALFAFGSPYSPPPGCPRVENPPRMR